MHSTRTIQPQAVAAALSFAHQKHARIRRAGKPAVVLCSPAALVTEPELALCASEEVGLIEPVLFKLAEHLVVLASGPDSGAEIEIAVQRFQRAITEQSAAPVGVGFSHNLRWDGPDARVSLEVLLEVAREGANVAQLGGGAWVCHSELYELFEGLTAAPRLLLPPTLRAREVPATSLVQPRNGIVQVDPTATAPDDPQLSRRLTKVLDQLACATARIRELERLVDADPGVASLHREAQGLDPSAPDRDLRLGLMGAIFRANLELRTAAARGAG